MAVITVLYITVNIHNHPRPVVMVTNNLAGLILSKVGCRDLGIYFSNKLSL
jgi:hypothetical protein